MTLSDDLAKLAELRASGTLSEEEFARAKERVLGAQAPHPQEPAVAAQCGRWALAEMLPIS